MQKEFTGDKVEECATKLKTRKAAGANEKVNGFLKYGGEGMITMMVMMNDWIWENEYTPKRWREGVVVNRFKKGDKADPGNYRGITLPSTVGKTFCKILNDSGNNARKSRRNQRGASRF